jgi:hypothetical protein
MPIDGGDKADDGTALDAALIEALDDLADMDRAAGAEAVDYRWLGVGMKLGLERPDQARSLLAMIAAKENADVVPPDGDAGADSGGGRLGPIDAEGPVSIPVASTLLARAAALPTSARTSVEPDAAFGWVTRLAPSEILQLGTIVEAMLDTGSPADIAKGFGITWSDGVRISRQELEAMVDEFTELEITVGGILAQRDLRPVTPAERPKGIAVWFGAWRPRTRPEETQAAEVIERSGEPARRGLVALWNVWMAMRYRAVLAPPTFDLLVRPWVTVVGPLPESSSS